MHRSRTDQLLGSLFLALAVFAVGCSELADPLERPGGNCVSCHTDQAILETVAEPDTTSEEPEGEG
ncbi:MAG: hypothetical protein GF330_00385 [Candidatus Eisenbacteria bacterium]|nr:hypothetical protein [Candidatus Eisenbacteria bacterium]